MIGGADAVSCGGEVQLGSEEGAVNLRKHGVSFEEALTVFLDPLARIHDDPDHSIGEWREIIVGTSTAGRLILISFTERGATVRLINAREPDRAERYDYEESV